MSQPTDSVDPLATLARVVSDVLAPAISVLLICMATGILGSDHLGRGLLWGGVAGLFCAAIPMVVIQISVRQKKLSDRHVTRREQRWWVFLTCLGSVFVGLLFVWLFHGPQLVLWALCTMIAGLIVTGVVTMLGVKISMHSFCLTALITMLTLLHSPWWMISAALLPLLFFARLRLRHHTLRELVLGTLAAIAVVLVSVQIFHPLTMNLFSG